MVNEEIVGNDIDYNWTFNSESDLSIVRGSENFSQAIYLRLTAYFDSLLWAYIGYGSYTKDWLGKNQTVYTRNTLTSEISKRVNSDPRVISSEVTIADWTHNSIGVKIKAQIADGTTFQEYFIFSDLPRTNDNINSPQWKNTWIDTRDEGYFAKRGEFVTVYCYVKDKENRIVPIGEVTLTLGGYFVEIEENPQEIAQSGTEYPGSCIFKFRIPPFIKLGTHKLKFKYKGIRGYNNCEGETDIHIVERLPTHMEFKYPNGYPTWYYANDYDNFTDPIVHVQDANDYDVLHGEVRYYLSNYVDEGSLVFIEFPIIFHGSTLLQRTVYILCKPEVLDYSEKFIFRLNYMFRPGDIFELVGRKGEHIDYLECGFEDDIFFLTSTIATKPYEDVDDAGNRLDTSRNDMIDKLRKSNSHIVMEVIE